MSFGGGGFGGSGFGSANNTTNNTGSLFGGGSSGFGSNNNNNAASGGFGSTSGGFGTNNNNNTANNTGGGVFGGASSGFGSGGFGSNTGGFGSAANTNNASATQNRPAFGASSTTGGGLFGNSGASGFGGGSGFGSNANNNTTSGFGGNSGGGIFGNSGNTANTGGFGGASNNASGGSIFGGGNTNNTTTGGFGSGAGFGSSAGTGFGAGTGAATQNQGTGGTPFQAFVENDGASNVKAHYQSLSFQDPYKNYSFEELRQVDYDQGRRFGNQNGQAGAFGSASTFGGQSSGGFGSNANTGASTGFGGGGFGANNNANTSTGFGGSSGGFGSNTGGGLFGSANKTTGGGLFGNSTATTTQSTSGGLFGSAGASNTSGFGQNNAAGGFGTQNKSLFGGATGGSTGGSTGGFGSSNTGSGGGGLFGNSANNASTSNNQTTGFGGGFGSNNDTQNQSGGFGFGNNNNTNNTQQNSTGGGLFGQNKPAAAGGLFGGTQNNQTQGTSLFGNSQQNNTSGGLFGQNKPAGGGGLFGSTPANNTGSTSLFGGNNNTQQNNTGGGGLFGQKPASSGLFGGTQNNNNTGGSLFGGSLNNNNQQQGQSNSLFGGSQSQNAGGSLFGSSMAQPQQSQQPQQLTASIVSSSPYGNEHLFANLGSPQQAVGPLATPLSSSQKPRRPAPLPAYKMNPSASTRLITPQKKQSYGFSYSTYGTPGSSYASSPYSGSLLSPSFGRTLTKSTSAGSLRNTYNVDDSILNPNAFSPGNRSARASGSMKKLQINRSLRTDLFLSPSDRSASPLKKAVSFDDDNSDATTAGGESSTALVRVEDNANPTAEDLGYLRSSTSRPAANGSSPEAPEREVTGNELATVPEHQNDAPQAAPPRRSRDDDQLARDQMSEEDQPLGRYWMQPSVNDLEKLSKQQRSHVPKFTVGRVGAGKVEFHHVDLNTVDLRSILTDIVRFVHRGITVYADHVNKPEQGKGLNVPATVHLENSWPRVHLGRFRSFDKSGVKLEKHIERLRRIPDTEFVKFDNETGTWTFRVQHFSTYELDDEDLSMSSMPGAIDDASSPLAMKRRGQRATAPKPSSALRYNEPVVPAETFLNRSLPGGFDDDSLFDAVHTSEIETQNMTESFLGDEMQLGEDTASHEMAEAPLADTDNVTMDGTVDIEPESEQQRHTPTRDFAFQPRSILKQSQGNRSVFGTPLRTRTLIDEDDWAGQLQRTLSPKKQDRQALRNNQDRLLQGHQPLQPTATFQQEPTHFANSMDIMNSLFGKSGSQNAKKQSSGSKNLQWPPSKRSKISHSASDDVFHASFKPRWAQDGSLVTAKHDTSNSQALTLRGSQRRRISINSDEIDRRAVFKQPRELSVIAVTADGVPRAYLPSTFNFADFAAALSLSSDANSKEEQAVWQLAQILFDSQDPTVDEDAARKKMLVRFWKSLVTSSALAQAQKAGSKEEEAIAYLSGYNVWGATEALLEGNDLGLATMVSQIDSANDMSQRDVAETIETWRENKDLSEIPARIRALYELLAGNVCTAEGLSGANPENAAETFNISKKFGLDWRRSFGLRLWYGTLMADPLTRAIDLYKEDLGDGIETVHPLPRFAKSRTASDGKDDRQDILFGLMQIYNHGRGEVSSILSPENTSGSALDSLLSFQLLQALSARGVVPAISALSTFSDSLTETLVAQLSAHDSTLHHALFVAMHFVSAAQRARSIQSLLSRYAGAIRGDESGSKFTFLTEELRIPAAWIHNALAEHAVGAEGNAALQAQHLLLAGDTRGAHTVLARQVAPRAVIEERLGELRASLAPFKTSMAVKLAEWTTGGGLYGDFAELVEKSGGVAAVKPGARPRFAPGALAEVQSLAKQLRAVLPKNQAWARLGREERAAVVEMGRVVTRIEGEVEMLRTGENAATRDAGKGAQRGRADEVLAQAQRLSEMFYGRAQVV